MRVLEVLKLASDHLDKHGSDSARLDAEVMLAQSLGLRRLDLYLQYDRSLSEAELSAYRAQIARRAHGEPVAYVVGHKEFMALDFEVTPAVLVPNPDTEVLVQLAVARAREAGRPLRMADVGTGSGCIAVAVAHYAPAVEVWASDVSSQALEVAARNVAKHAMGERIHLATGDLMEPLPGTFDMICANLPYVAAGTTLPVEVRLQPSIALYAEGNGADVVVRLLEAAPARLNPGGRVLLEIGPGIVSLVLDTVERQFSERRVHQDLGGHDRVLEAWS
ncbi:MAG: peptide chain release factor N(5)-glutamine methyltransferase [Chloroflexi bacterium]|nr:MAG: peptide chain release factor N(5)-glutamine methyltransferase [Chloroflexota bacterium]TMC71116.1 MAG: peptide chain release factor N(5)-glutamine methyltransferase [Chloroflexota bacterium]